jgi:cation diffusion facilitator family transporter
MAPLGIFLCAVLMGMASMEVMRESIAKLSTLWSSGISGLAQEDDIVLSSIVFYSMAFGFVSKLSLYVYCQRVYRKTGNDSVKAVALDHLNDVFSILSATLAAVSSYYSPNLIWVDPISAIAISVYIMKEWWGTAEDQAHMLVGKAASPEFLDSIRSIVNSHHSHLRPDLVRAYHFGPKFLVEVEVILPRDMTLLETHDIGMELQHKLEAIDEVERAFVHIDYQERDYDEHRPESWPDHYAHKINNVIRSH